MGCFPTFATLYYSNRRASFDRLWHVPPQAMEKIIRYLEGNQPRFIRELEEYVRFPSVSAQPERQADLLACAEWIRRHCEEVIGLETCLRTTRGNPVVVAKTPRSSPKPHYLVYGHYDVQPGQPDEEWNPPGSAFEPRVQDNRLCGRGSSDNKGQHFAHLKAIEAWLKTGMELPCDLTVLLEGEEETGGRSLAEYVEANRDELACEAVIISDSAMADRQHPALTCSLRGIATLELAVHGPNRDLHSGGYGGCIDNPALVLCQMLAKLRDERGRITIPGFYEEVLPLTDFEKKQLQDIDRLPGNQARALERDLGVPRLFGEQGYSATELRKARPTLEINGLTSGYQGTGSKTIIPAWAKVKLTLRLVARQDPTRITGQLRRHLESLCPPTVRLEFLADDSLGTEAYCVPASSPAAQAGWRALRAAFQLEPVLERAGGSIPIVTEFKRILSADSLLLGLGLPEDNIHSPNESFGLDRFAQGQLMSAQLWRELMRAG